MNRHFVIEFDYFNKRENVFKCLSKIAKKQSVNTLTGYQIFINNIPTSLEFYVFLAYEGNSENEITEMKDLLFPLGIYRPDISISTLLYRMGDRGFNSYSITPWDLNTKLILQDGFFYKNKDQVPSYNFFSRKYRKILENEGYKAFEKLKKGTTIFISHSSKQKKELLENVVPFLNSIDELVWIDKYRINQDTNIDKDLVKREIAIGLNKAHKVLFYITSDFLKSNWCKLELELSFSIKEEKHKKYLLYFIVDNEINEEFMQKYKVGLEKIQPENIKILEKYQNLEDILFDIKNALIH